MPYYTEEYRGINRPETVRMYFELPCLDWCRFEKSDLNPTAKSLEEEAKLV